MKITFLGAAHEVTGSCTLIELGSTKFIIDCGMEQGKDIFVNETLPVNPTDVDFVLLTHAHIDHSGNLPLLYKNGFRGVVYATEPTCNLCSIMLRDSAHIQMSEAEYKTRKSQRAGGPEIKPVYDMNDAEGLLTRLRPCTYAERIQVSEDVYVRFTDVGHLLGSACIEIWMTEKGEERKIVFSGDLGNINQPLLRDPSKVKDADYVVMESTYGLRSHGDRPDYIKALTEAIQRTFDRGGNVVIPSFAVGRTQEMLYFIREIKERGLIKGHSGFKVYVDSPLAIEATGIFLQADRSYLDAETVALLDKGVDPLYFDGLETSVSVDESRAINADKAPKVIISASGMCDAGRIRHHLKHNLWREESLILFVGYQAVGTLGRLLHDGAKSVRLFGEDIAVNAEVSWLAGVSGHADRNGLLNWLSGFSPKPRLVFINHGDNEVCDEFTKNLNEDFGYTATSPYSGTSYDLLTAEAIGLTVGIPVAPKAVQKPRKEAVAYRRAVEAAERLLRRVRGLEGRANEELREITRKIEAILRNLEK